MFVALAVVAREFDLMFWLQELRSAVEMMQELQREFDNRQKLLDRMKIIKVKLAEAIRQRKKMKRQLAKERNKRKRLELEKAIEKRRGKRMEKRKKEDTGQVNFDLL